MKYYNEIIARSTSLVSRAVLSCFKIVKILNFGAAIKGITVSRTGSFFVKEGLLVSRGERMTSYD